MDDYDLASEIEDRLFKIRKVLDLCMEYLGTNGGKGMDHLETTLWVVEGLAKEAEQKFATYRSYIKGCQDADKQDDFEWDEFDKLLSEKTSEWNDAGEVELAFQDTGRKRTGKKVSSKGNKK
jgi:hypothetical protein